MRFKRREQLNILGIFCFVLIFVFSGLYLYNQRLKNLLSESIGVTMSELADGQRRTVDMELRAQRRAIESIARMLEERPGDVASSGSLLARLEETTNFESLYLQDKSGKLISSTGVSVDVSQMDYFKKAVSGQTAVSGAMASPVDGQRVIMLATPIWEDGSVKQILTGMQTFARMNYMLGSSFEGMGFAFVLDGEGVMIAKTDNYHLTDSLNAFHIWSESTFFYDYSAEKIMDDIRNGRPGRSDYSFGGVRRFIEYRPLQANGWMLAIVVPEEIVGNEATVISREATWLTLAVSCCGALVMGYLYWQRRRQDFEKQEHVTQLEQIAYFDTLTQLPNAYKFKLMGSSYVEEHPRTPFTVVKLDVMNFKVINDLFGFEVGDKVLLSIAELLREICLPAAGGLRELSRVGGDEFLMIHSRTLNNQEMLLNFEDFEATANAMLKMLLGKHKLTFRYGIYRRSQGTGVEEAVEKANLAHRETKSNKNDRICYYDDSIRAKALRQVEVENSMEAALRNQEFQIYLQPKYELQGETLSGAEALVRWIREDGSMVMPGDFISLFEKNGFITQLDLYMFTAVCDLICRWLKEGLTPPTISVNFSRLHLSSPSFVEDLATIADTHGAPRGYLEIELTETVIFENEAVLMDVLSHLHDLGFTLSMDDFGAGYSSLGLLKNLPVDAIKIDKSFFAASREQERVRAVLQSVMEMAKRLRIYTVAEGVETQEQVILLKEIGCDMVQGYFFAKPMPVERFYETQLQAIKADCLI